MIDEPYEPCDEDDQPVDTQSHVTTSAPVNQVNIVNASLESLIMFDHCYAAEVNIMVLHVWVTVMT